MSIDDFLDCMPDTVIHSEFSSRDAYNVPTYGSPVSYSARVVEKPTWVRAFNGSEVVARGWVWIGAALIVNPQDQLQLPDGTTPPLLAAEHYPDENGDHHTKVFYG